MNEGSCADPIYTTISSGYPVLATLFLKLNKYVSDESSKKHCENNQSSAEVVPLVL